VFDAGVGVVEVAEVVGVVEVAEVVGVVREVEVVDEHMKFKSVHYLEKKF
jgi:hypothetical protein